MDASGPKCPTCGAPVEADWDWCQLCGYDPEGLKPAGWISPQLYDTLAPPAQTTQVKTRTRKEKAERKSERKSKRDAAPAVAKAPKRKSVPKAGAGAQTFRVKASGFEVGAAVVLLAVAVLLGYFAVSGLLSINAELSMLNNAATVLFIVVCAVLAFAAVAQGLALLRVKVVLTPSELIVHNRIGRARRVAVADIHGLRMGQRQFVASGWLSQPMEAPYLQLRDGSGLWLDALGARSPFAPPSHQQLALLASLTAAVGLDPGTAGS